MEKDIITILILGDIIGSPGIEQVFIKLASLKKREHIDIVIANGENSDEGFGITEQIISQLKNSGVDVITSGNHIWSNRDAGMLLDQYDYLLRPANYPDAPGKGYCTLEFNGIRICVINLIGRYHMTPLDCPFQVLSKLMKKQAKNCQAVIVDFHAESSQEKQALAYDFDGQVSFVAGTHTHVQTADDKILPSGTGYITDVGMCGGIDSVIGMEREGILEKIMTQTNVPFTPSREQGRLQGVLVKIDTNSGKTVNLQRLNI